MSEASNHPLRVTFFEDRAEIIRELVMIPTAGWNDLTAISSLVDDGSLSVRSLSGSSVREQRVRRRLVEEKGENHANAEALEEAVTTCARRKAASEAVLAGLVIDLERVHQMRRTALSALTTAERTREQAEAWRAAHRALESSEQALLTKVAEVRSEDIELADALARARERHAGGRATTWRHEAAVQVFLEASPKESEPTRVEVRYRVPCALWRPEHTVTVTRNAETASVEWTVWATAWQCTGETFTDAACIFSTARPAKDAALPMTQDDVIASMRKTEVAITIEARTEVVATVGPQAGKVTDSMPGVDDGGTPLTLSAREHVTILSTGRPTRLAVGHHTLVGTLTTVVTPELDEVPHLRLEAVAPGPLLAGPVHASVDGTHAGRSQTRFVAAGDRFELGVGTDDDVRVRRTVEEKRDTTVLIGTQLIVRTVTLWLVNVSSRPKRIVVRERVPVSEIAGLKIDVKAQGFVFDAKTGFLERGVAVGANATEIVSFTIELKAPAKMVLAEI